MFGNQQNRLSDHNNYVRADKRGNFQDDKEEILNSLYINCHTSFKMASSLSMSLFISVFQIISSSLPIHLVKLNQSEKKTFDK